MIDIEQVVFEELQPEMRELLRATLPNLGFFSLLETVKLKINQDLVNLNTNCSDDVFRQKYNKLLLERELYEGLERTTRRFQIDPNEER